MGPGRSLRVGPRPPGLRRLRLRRRRRRLRGRGRRRLRRRRRRRLGLGAAEAGDLALRVDVELEALRARLGARRLGLLRLRLLGGGALVDPLPAAPFLSFLAPSFAAFFCALSSRSRAALRLRNCLRVAWRPASGSGSCAGARFEPSSPRADRHARRVAAPDALDLARCALLRRVLARLDFPRYALATVVAARRVDTCAALLQRAMRCGPSVAPVTARRPDARRGRRCASRALASRAKAGRKRRAGLARVVGIATAWQRWASLPWRPTMAAVAGPR